MAFLTWQLNTWSGWADKTWCIKPVASGYKWVGSSGGMIWVEEDKKAREYMQELREGNDLMTILEIITTSGILDN